MQPVGLLDRRDTNDAEEAGVLVFKVRAAEQYDGQVVRNANS